ncbi:MAG: hypothetical protein ACRDTN_15645 [Mycobacterium sp.]
MPPGSAGKSCAGHADEQHRWALRGDDRGVYGSDGAKLMRSFSPRPQLDGVTPDPGEVPEIAAIAYTESDLAAPPEQRLPGWHWAAFGSVLVQRRAALRSRLRDQRLCYAPPSGMRAHTDDEAAALVRQWIDETCVLVAQVEELMLSSGFQEIFDGSFNEDTGDADGVLQTAHRLMDLHEQFLRLSERCRGLTASASCTDLLNDCAHMIDVPLEGYRRFIDDFVARMAEIPGYLRWARGPVALDPVLLDLEGDDDLLARFFERLREVEAP